MTLTYKGWYTTKSNQTVPGWLKKFRLSYKKLDNQTRSRRPKTVNSKAVFKAIEAILVSNTRRVSG